MPDSISTEQYEAMKSEYDSIQDKIDKIGEFKFRVRGWSLTLQTAIIAALISSKDTVFFRGLTPVFVLFPALLIVTLFHYLEQQQENFSTNLGKRAKALENILDIHISMRKLSETQKRLYLKTFVDELGGSPRISAVMQIAARRPLMESLKDMRRIKVNLFYHAQYILVLIAILGVWGSMGVKQ